MPIIRTTEYRNYSEILDEIDNLEEVMKATAELLEAAMRDGESLKRESHGVYLILKRQADDLAFFRRTLAEPHRVCRRLQLLRKWSHHEQDNEQVFT